MEAVIHDRAGLEEGFQHQDEEGCADALAGGDPHVLCDANDGIDLMISPQWSVSRKQPAARASKIRRLTAVSAP
jgi:hypothetical protein